MRNLKGKTAQGTEVELYREVSATKFNSWEWHVVIEDASQAPFSSHAPDAALARFNSMVAPEYRVK